MVIDTQYARIYAEDAVRHTYSVEVTLGDREATYVIAAPSTHVAIRSAIRRLSRTRQGGLHVDGACRPVVTCDSGVETYRAERGRRVTGRNPQTLHERADVVCTLVRRDEPGLVVARAARDADDAARR